MKIENTYTAAIGTMFLAEIESIGITKAINYFNEKIDQRITGFEIYRNGKLAYDYTRKNDFGCDKLIPIG